MKKNRFIILCLLLSSILVGCSREEVLKPSATQQSVSGLASPSLSIPTLIKSSTVPISTDVTALMPADSSETPTPLIIEPLLNTPIPTHLPVSTLSPVIPGWLAFSVLGSYPPGIAIINSHGSNWKWIASELPGYEVGDYNSPSWSPDGHWVAFTLDPGLAGGTQEIFIANVDGSEWRRVTYDDLPNYSLTWSPNGQEIAYTTPKLYKVNLSTGYVRELAGDLLTIGNPAWSPDGHLIAFLGMPELGSHYLYTVESDGNDIKQLSDFQVGNSRLSWSPNGQEIAYRSADECGDICIYRLSDGSNNCLTHTSGGEQDPTWSPDGNHIAFLATQENILCKDQANGEPVVLGWQVYVMNVDGSGVTKLTNTNDSYVGLVWSPVPTLQIGKAYTITEWGDRLNLRNSPSLNGTSLFTLMKGDLVKVIEGPVDADDYYWWKLRTDDGMEGWAVEVYRWYQPVSP